MLADITVLSGQQSEVLLQLLMISVIVCLASVREYLFPPELHHENTMLREFRVYSEKQCWRVCSYDILGFLYVNWWQIILLREQVLQGEYRTWMQSLLHSGCTVLKSRVSFETSQNYKKQPDKDVQKPYSSSLCPRAKSVYQLILKLAWLIYSLSFSVIIDP